MTVPVFREALIFGFIPLIYRLFFIFTKLLWQPDPVFLIGPFSEHLKVIF